MSTNEPTEEWLSRPIKEVIREVARSVAESQEELDRRAMAVQREFERAAERGDLRHEMDASWLRFSGVDVDLEVGLSVEGEREVDDEGQVRAYRPRISVTPVGPRSKTVYDFEADVTSEVRLQIVPVPPERRGRRETEPEPEPEP